jgi:tetraacyldisaccharide-1-P 4'-kinase
MYSCSTTASKILAPPRLRPRRRTARFYREGRSALKDADAVIPRHLRTVVPEELRGKRVFAFGGLADNEQFFASLREASLDVAGTRSFPDHHRYTAADVDALKRDANGLPLVWRKDR